MNPVAPWPTDPSKYLELEEKMWAVIDDLIKKGMIRDFGAFLNGTSGYAIGEGESADLLRSVSMFLPYFESEVHEVMPFERVKEITREICKAQIAAAKK